MGATAETEIPVGRSYIIERPRLTRLLDESSARAIMLVAPAGYGKTTLARQWLATRRHAWYEASAASSDVAALALGLADAASAVLPAVGRRLREWLPTSPDPESEVEVIAELLSGDLEGWPEDAWLAIDDYHRLASEASEALLQLLLREVGCRILITSRRRPSWSAARDLLYGHFLELGPSTLAMTMDEATAVLPERFASATRGLVALANGWPAVIGLAAHSPKPIEAEEHLPAELHDYLAEELFVSLPPPVQRDLSKLALLPTLDPAVVEALVDSAATTVLQEAERTGLLIADSPAGPPRLHPLIRAFLHKKADELPPAELDVAVRSASDHFIGSGRWDDAFDVISDLERPDLIHGLFSVAMAPLLKGGRIATLRVWLTWADERGVQSPQIDLARAELLYRQGSHDRAVILALSAASALEDDDVLKSSAYYRAGQSSYLMDRASTAFEYFQLARRHALTVADSRNSLWGEFGTLVELERPESIERLEEFGAVGPQDRDALVRLAGGRLVLAAHRGLVEDALTQAAPITEIVSEASDPTVRSAFWHVYATALALATHYHEALDAAAEAEREAKNSHIEFAIPYVHFTRGAAYVGLRRFAEADAAISTISSFAGAKSDNHLRTYAALLRTRRLLSEGLIDSAVEEAASFEVKRPLSPSLESEFLLTWAAGLAALDRVSLALELVARAEGLSAYLLPRLLAEWTRAICTLHTDRGSGEAALLDAYASTAASGALDVLVLAYRLHDAVLPSLAKDKGTHRNLARVMCAANDHLCARRIGIKIEDGLTSRPPETMLTKREREVYGLLAQGMTNREIAQALVISELTAKVHVRHILQKLGVRSRTIAALRATRDATRGTTDAS